ncbi:hypothetical protein [Paraburkholderia humisilvae]|uniref:Uncharacterized protein n=1 Tax=Paraburkholderia humisilvae TaxID=627669 RepID=A0A6J5DK03_9BURK|nr:hypothetical protein [Paraburkholderia humisilvae]CAB3754620.1 hypothetical protein LMG29542_02401 [Paraburkholderia humisilvae]
MLTREIPSPESRVAPALYLELRGWLLANDPDARRIVEWSAHRRSPPDSPEKMASEIIWIVLCAGRSAQAARTIEQKVWSAIHQQRPVVEVFGFRGKAAAIERAWAERIHDFEALQKVLALHEPAKLVDWCGNLPWVGEDTKFQLAKNFGVDVPKPDIWLCRLSGLPDRPRRNAAVRFEACMNLCRLLSVASEDSVATVDSVLWLACNKGILQVDADAGAVRFSPGTITRAEVIPESSV